MSDFWKKFKGVFIVEDPNAKSSNEVENQHPAPQQPNNSTKEAAEVRQKPISTEGGTVQEKFMQVLFEAMGKSNLDGFDYFEFKQALTNLQNMPMDEATRYKSAFAMAQTMGVSPDKLINTALHYMDILKNEQAKFNAAVENQRKTQVGDKESAIQNLDATIKQKAEQIKKLTEEIQQHQAQMEQMKNEISTAMVKVEQTHKDFVASYNLLAGQIQSDINNMKNYLKS
jgi:lysyl-tRNA synthetase class I